jgi:hypothetical protein
MRKLFTTKELILHYASSPHWFFNGYGGYQVKVRRLLFCGIRYRTLELDREDVPHYHYVQQRTLGCSEWRSKFAAEIDAQKRARSVEKHG